MKKDRGIRISSYMYTCIFWHPGISVHNARTVVRSFIRKHRRIHQIVGNNPGIEIGVDGGRWHELNRSVS